MHVSLVRILVLASVFVFVGAGCSTGQPSTPLRTNTYSTEAPAVTPADAPAPADASAPAAVTASTSTSEPLTTNPAPTMEFNAERQYTAILHTTKGDIEIALNKGQTPNTVKNFVDLANKNFYNNTVFHRVISGFMIQGGDPKGNGTGGPGYQFDDEPFTGEYTRGTVAMANAGPNTNGSQFFIMHADYPLPKNYTIFGRVTKGLETVDAIAASKVTYGPSGEPSSPVEPTTVTSVEIKEE